jgi:NhaA family Na+:H+ antiporter
MPPTPPKQRISSVPPEAWTSLVRLMRLATQPLDRFLRIEAASGILLLVFAAVALAWANSPWAGSYCDLWQAPVGIRIGRFSFEKSLAWAVNDGLMVIFFFVVGMEIRHELHDGELSDWRRAALPATAALGGMLAPAGLYLWVANAPLVRSGWGVPMATDIAFAVGILTLLGKRVPPSLRVLLLALAVIDDLGAIIVIALFYSSGIVLSGLLIAGLGLVGIFAMQRFGVRAKVAYVVPGIVLWAGVYTAGVHPTIAGVIIGLVTPVRVWLGPQGFVVGARQELERLTQVPPDDLSSHALAGSLRHMDVAGREAMSPAESLITKLHPWVAFGIMPIFALANAGVALATGPAASPTALPTASSPFASLSWTVTAAVGIGLVLGKPAGILLASWIALRLRLAVLPADLRMRHLVVLGVVAGVGFTMALFIAQLAFSDEAFLKAAKLGVLAASALAAVLGLVCGRLILHHPVATTNFAQPAGQAESSTEP